MKQALHKPLGIVLASVVLCFLGPTKEVRADVNDYPNSDVKIVVPAPPGSGPDSIGRLLSEQLAKKWDQPVIIDNLTGAGGVIGHDRGARAKPDGYTLLMGLIGPMSVRDHLVEDLPYDPFNDLDPVTLLVTLPNLLVVNPNVPANNLQELVAYAKEHPNELRYGFPGHGTSPHLAAEQLNMMAGMHIQGIPYTKSSQMTVDLIGGQIEMMFHNVPVVLQHTESGEIKALGITSMERNPAVPNIPTLDEQGLDGYEMTSWYGIWVPAGTPEAIIKKLHEDIAEALQHPNIERWMTTQAGTPGGGTPEELAEFQRVESEKWAKLIKAAHIKLE